MVPPTLDVLVLTKQEHLVSCNLAQTQSRLGLVLCIQVGLGGRKQSGTETVGKPSLCPHCCLLCPPLQSAAVAERERVSQMFAEATATLQSFQNEVMGFIEEGETTMLGRSQGDLRRQEEQRSRLSKARHNLSQVPEADSVSFLQVRAAQELQRELRGWGWVEKRW